MIYMKPTGFEAFFLTCILLCLVSSCDKDDSDQPDFKQEMRDFVQKISEYAKTTDADFLVIPQNGQELVTVDGDENGEPEYDYLAAIDGVGREDLFYGFKRDNDATPGDEKEYMLSFLLLCEQNGIEVLTTDYCWDHSKMDDSYQQNNQRDFISFAAPDRELNTIPDYPVQPYEVNADDIHNLNEVKNFLYLLNPEHYADKEDYLGSLNQTDYDVIIVDLFFEDEELSSSDIASMKVKQNGGQRLVIAYMSIGEAEDYRFYWQNSWKVGEPGFLEKENRQWRGNYKVKYWDPDWQAMILGGEHAYLDKILAAGFDGVYLDIIDAFEYFE